MKIEMRWRYAWFWLLLMVSCVWAGPSPLPVDQVFPLKVSSPDSQTVVVEWDIQPGYYLYRDRLYFSLAAEAPVQLGEPHFPPAVNHTNPILGQFAAYEKQTAVAIPILSARVPEFLLQIKFQGCAEQGYCYPPVTRAVSVRLGANAANVARVRTPTTERLFQSPYHWSLWLGFFGLGLLIALTPCVLPMIPVLFGLIIGKEHVGHLRAFFISLFYVLGMAITYAIAGILFGWLGGSLQAFLQKPWIIALFSFVFIAMALSLFGFYSIQLPEKIRASAAHLSDRQKRGGLWSAFVMGCLSTLILSPCATPALVGVLGYISQSGSIAVGGLALFIIGLGSGVPLLFIGAFGRRLLPKSGPWMRIVENVLGIVLLGVAIWMLGRIVPDKVSMLLWAALLIGVSVYMKAFSATATTAQRVAKGLGVLIFVYAILIMVGVTQGNTNVFEPLSLRTPKCFSTPEIAFIPVRTVSDIEREMRKSLNKPVLIDFYADWCVSCRIIEKEVFGDAAVQKALSGFLLLRVDVTAYDARDQEIMRYYNVVAPPTILLFDAEHQELKSDRIVGEISADRFLFVISKMTP